YGVGSPNARDGLRSTDAILGRLRARLRDLGQEGSTDIIVVSDHGHSNVSGSQKLFPLRAVKDGQIGEVDPHGYSVSGLVRLADVMHRAGFTIFVDSRYGELPGTLPLGLIRVENTSGRNPDVVVSYDYDVSATIGGVQGTEYSGSLLNNPYRGMHGSFSPLDVHNTLIAFGPDF